MRIKALWIICFFLSIVAMAIIAPSAYSGYVQLDARLVELHGPFCWDKLGVAQDEQTCDMMMRILASGDKHKFFKALNSYKIFRVEKNTKAVVLEIKLFEGKAKVVILSGLHKDFTGWVPLAWLDGNEKRPRLAEYQENIYRMPF